MNIFTIKILHKYFNGILESSPTKNKIVLSIMRVSIHTTYFVF